MIHPKPPKPASYVPDCPCPKCGSTYAVIEFRRAKIIKKRKSFWSFFIGVMPGALEVQKLPDRIHMECSTCGHLRWIRPMDHQNRTPPQAARNETQGAGLPDLGPGEMQSERGNVIHLRPTDGGDA